MPSFLCQVCTKQGQTREVLRSAASSVQLKKQLESEGLFVIKIKQEKQGSFTRKAVNRKFLGSFSSAMSMLLESGLSLKDALALCVQLFPKGPGGLFITTIREEIEKGSSFASALASYPGVFPLYARLISIAEKAENYEKVFAHLKNYLEEEGKIKEKMINALIYPCLVLSLCIGGLIFLAFYVLPLLKDQFSALSDKAAQTVQQNLASISALAIGASLSIIILLFIMMMITLGRRFSPSFRLSFDRFLMSFPPSRLLFLPREILRFCFGLELLCQCGMPLDAALKQGKTLLKNHFLAAEITDCLLELEKGGLLSESLAKRAVFPKILVLWVQIGESTGNIEASFGQLRGFYQQKIETQTVGITALFEPALIALIGIFLIILVLNLIVPIFSVYGNIL